MTFLNRMMDGEHHHEVSGLCVVLDRLVNQRFCIRASSGEGHSFVQLRCYDNAQRVKDQRVLACSRL